MAIVAVAIAGAVGMAIYVRHQNPVQNPRYGRGGRGGFNGQPMAVAVATVSTGDIVVRIPALGAVTPLATVTVRTQISGQLQQVAFKEGQLVHRGDFIAQIDPRPYEAALNQMTATLHKDQASLANARQDLKRYEGLIAEDAIAQQQLDTQRALVAQDEGQVEADEAQVKTAALNLQYTHIVSPVTGRVGLRQVDPGNYVTPGDTNGLVVITELQPITVIFSIPEDYVHAILQKTLAGATLTVEAYDRSNTTKLAEGKLLTIDNTIDATTGTFKLRALFDNQDNQLFPQQFVNVQLVEDVLKNQVVMPSSAVHRGAPNGVVSTFVYLVNSADSTVAVHPVVLGTVDGERVAVTSGLAAGDIVVTEGGDRLRDGAEVQLPPPPSDTKVAQSGRPGAPPGVSPQGGNKKFGKWKGSGKWKGKKDFARPPQ